jgi:hypothetical protein
MIEMRFISLQAGFRSLTSPIFCYLTHLKAENNKKQSCFLDGRHCNYYVPNRNNCYVLPNLGDLTIPVFIYALVISTMLLFALKAFYMEETGKLVYFDRAVLLSAQTV